MRQLYSDICVTCRILFPHNVRQRTRWLFGISGNRAFQVGAFVRRYRTIRFNLALPRVALMNKAATLYMRVVEMRLLGTPSDIADVAARAEYS